MNDEFEGLEMYQLDHQEVAEALKNSSKKRGAITVAKFSITGELVWTIEPDIEQFSHYNVRL